ncbi:MAG TPA: lipid A deacylase LpxR family protein [Gammaproteobacteria bacterium]
MGCACISATQAENEETPDLSHRWQEYSKRLNDEFNEPHRITWSVYFDNDLLTSPDKDRDYTGGLTAAFSGSAAKNHIFSIDGPLEYLNKFLGVDRAYNDNSNIALHAYEIGLEAFTPDNIKTKEPLFDDRPYASLVYISNTRQYFQPEKKVSWVTSLSVGLLGLNAVGELQNDLHDLFGSRRAEGWENQISEGGEPTFRYSVTRQKYHNTGTLSIDFTSAARVSVGYLTEVSYGGGFRWGKIRSPWWKFNADLNPHGVKEDPTPVTASHRDELYCFAGVNLRLRLYNALLQGQFRDSAVEYDHEQLNRLILEGWIGVTKEFSSGFRISYVVRRQSSEFKEGLADRPFTWGGIIISYQYG